nr:hypothetical protein [Cressdnaviricota sp.]
MSFNLFNNCSFHKSGKSLVLSDGLFIVKHHLREVMQVEECDVLAAAIHMIAQTLTTVSYPTDVPSR